LETVYTAQPQGFVDNNNPTHVCLLYKSLYRLKQSLRAWFAKLSATLIEVGFKASSFDPSLFMAHHQGETLLILVYVDDIIVTGSNLIQVEQCINQLSRNFSIRNLGDLHFFFGIEVSKTPDGLLLTQTKYLTDLLQRVNMSTCKSVSSPMASRTSLSKHGSVPCENPHLYRSVVGGLQHATLTRPDIAFSVNKVSHFMHMPTEENWIAVKRIVRYISGTLDYGLKFYKNSTTQIHAYVDADWAGNLDDRRSTSGFCVYNGRNLIS
jgi:Reverse transcriptase (RNA-dependent DNA polymerase)